MPVCLDTTPTAPLELVRPHQNPKETIRRAAAEAGGEAPEEFRERRRLVRRRANPMQGRSLEKLGHAVEYLADSRMFLVEPSTAKAEREALQILMRASRTVFAECEEVVSLWDRVTLWWARRAKRRPGTAAAANSLPRL